MALRAVITLPPTAAATIATVVARQTAAFARVHAIPHAALAAVAVDYLRAAQSAHYCKAQQAVAYLRVEATGVFVDNQLVYRAARETLALAESVSLTYEAVQSDSVSMSDSMAQAIGYGREFVDSLTMADLVSMLVQYTREITDSATATDSPTLDLAKVAEDVVAIAEAVALAIGLAPGDTATLAEQAVLEVAKALTDSAPLTESAARDLSKSIADTPSISDSVALAPSLVATDSVSPTESLSIGWDKVLTDTASLSESSTLDIGLGPVDTPVLSDEVVLVAVWFREFDDGFTLDDSSNASGFDLNKSNLVTMSDQTEWVFASVYTDSATLTDSAALSTDKALSDTMTVPDTVAADFSKAPPDETLTLGDSAVLDLVAGGVSSAVLNTSPLNEFTLNQ